MGQMYAIRDWLQLQEPELPLSCSWCAEIGTGAEQDQISPKPKGISVTTIRIRKYRLIAG